MSTPVPGWYDDGAGRQRWWDGAGWTEHVVSQPEQPAPASGPERSTRWVWVVAGTVATVLVVATVAVLGLNALRWAPIAEAKRVVDNYNIAWLHANCDELRAATTANFREEWDYVDCASFEEEAEAFDQAERDFTVTVNEARRVGSHVIVSTTESYTDPQGERLVDYARYTVVNDGGTWRIDSIKFGSEGKTTSA